LISSIVKPAILWKSMNNGMVLRLRADGENAYIKRIFFR